MSRDIVRSLCKFIINYRIKWSRRWTITALGETAVTRGISAGLFKWHDCRPVMRNRKNRGVPLRAKPSTHLAVSSKRCHPYFTHCRVIRGMLLFKDETGLRRCFFFWRGGRGSDPLSPPLRRRKTRKWSRKFFWAARIIVISLLYNAWRLR